MYVESCLSGVRVQRCTFTNNRVASYSPRLTMPGQGVMGSALASLSSPVDFFSSTFTNNTSDARNPDPPGLYYFSSQGTIALQSITDMNVSVDGCLFKNNKVRWGASSATAQGAGVHLQRQCLECVTVS